MSVSSRSRFARTALSASFAAPLVLALAAAPAFATTDGGPLTAGSNDFIMSIRANLTLDNGQVGVVNAGDVVTYTAVITPDGNADLTQATGNLVVGKDSTTVQMSTSGPTVATLSHTVTRDELRTSSTSTYTYAGATSASFTVNPGECEEGAPCTPVTHSVDVPAMNSAWYLPMKAPATCGSSTAPLSLGAQPKLSIRSKYTPIALAYPAYVPAKDYRNPHTSSASPASYATVKWNVMSGGRRVDSLRLDGSSDGHWYNTTGRAPTIRDNVSAGRLTYTPANARATIVADEYWYYDTSGNFKAASEKKTCSYTHQNTASVDVRFGSQAMMSTKRVGSRLTVTLKSNRYSPFYHKFVGYGGARASLQQKSSNGSWVTIATRKVHNSGRAYSFKLYRPKKKIYRVSIATTSQVWGTVSAATIR